MQVFYYFAKNANAQPFVTPAVEFGMIMEMGDRSLEQDIFIRRKKERYYTYEEIE